VFLLGAYVEFSSKTSFTVVDLVNLLQLSPDERNYMTQLATLMVTPFDFYRSRKYVAGVRGCGSLINANLQLPVRRQQWTSVTVVR